MNCAALCCGALAALLCAACNLAPPDTSAQRGQSVSDNPAAPVLGPPVESFDAADALSIAGGAVTADALLRELVRREPQRVAAAARRLLLAAIATQECARFGLPAPHATGADLAALRRRLAEDAEVAGGAGADAEAYCQSIHGMKLALAAEILATEHAQRTALESVLRLRALLSERWRVAVIVAEDEATAQEIHSKLCAGAEFEALARKESLHPSAPMGGVLPALLPEALSPRAHEALSQFAVGECSGVLPAEGGRYEVVRLLERLAPQHAAIATARAALRAALQCDPVSEFEWRTGLMALERLYKVERGAILGRKP